MNAEGGAAPGGAAAPGHSVCAARIQYECNGTIAAMAALLLVKEVAWSINNWTSGTVSLVSLVTRWTKAWNAANACSLAWVCAAGLDNCWTLRQAAK